MDKQISLKKPIKTGSGFKHPLGVSLHKNGVNFALRSKNASGVTLCLFQQENKIEIVFDPQKNKTADIWHVFLEEKLENTKYAFFVDGLYVQEKGHLFNREKLVSDPFSIRLDTPYKWGEEKKGVLKGFVEKKNQPFDWQGIKKPNLPKDSLLIYEMHVRGFTKDPSSKTKYPGSFLGVIEKIPYLKKLGINVVELLPIFEFDECANFRKNPQTNESLYNYWGYSPMNFFSIMNRFASGENADVIFEFKQMVKELHKSQIEVILDVVYNHTAEGGDKDFYLNYRGIDNRSYYLIDEKGNYIDFSGCGNTFRANSSMGEEIILESLRYFSQEMQIDGFRFDLASILTRDERANPTETPSLIEKICEDRILSKLTLIAEPWDLGGLYQVGSFPSWGKWAEWNGKYRDTVRGFFIGEHQTKDFIECLCGFKSLYKKDRKAYHSINFITCHDGFTLNDLVSFEKKHNEENGEENRDGLDQNFSWNCGHEGETTDKQIQEIRNRQKKNFLFTLMVSQGTPMILMGDEYGHTRKGNNNAWCQDNSLNWFLWNKVEENSDFFEFFLKMVQFRKNHLTFSQTSFLEEHQIQWYNDSLSWNAEKFFLSCTIKKEDEVFYLAFNPTKEKKHFTLPKIEKNMWEKYIDTFFPTKENFFLKEIKKEK